MTAANAGAPRAEPSPRPPANLDESAVGTATVRGCPFLVSQAGGWRLDLPSRDHRCAAVSPPAALAPEKQSRLCLTSAHTSCATYLASLAAREARLGAVPTERATRWGLARTTTVIEDAGGIRARLTAVLLDRRRWPAIPAVLLVTTLLALAISGFRAGVPASTVATPSPRASTSIATPANTLASTPTAPPSPTASLLPTATPAPTPVPTPTAAPTKKPQPTFRTYVVRPGDTLSGIASRFNTSVAAIVALNKLVNPSLLSVGQVLLIPN